MFEIPILDWPWKLIIVHSLAVMMLLWTGSMVSIIEPPGQEKKVLYFIWSAFVFIFVVIGLFAHDIVVIV